MRNVARGWFAAVAMLGALIAPDRAAGQGAVAIAPQVGMIPDGVGLGVTPAVSADRRYVRLSIGFGSSTVQGFQNITFPAGAVGGSGGGGGTSVLTGMNGPIESGGMTGEAPAMMGPVGYGSGFGPGFDDFSGPSSPGAQPRRVEPRRTRADRAKEQRARAVAAKAEAAKQR